MLNEEGQVSGILPVSVGVRIHHQGVRVLAGSPCSQVCGARLGNLGRESPQGEEEDARCYESQAQACLRVADPGDAQVALSSPHLGSWPGTRACHELQSGMLTLVVGDQRV